MTGFSDSAQEMSLVAFIAVATVSLLLCVMMGPDRDDLDEFYTGYRSLSPMRNGLAIAGDYISAATVLGTIGIVSLVGYDGVVLALSTALSLVLLMFLMAEPLRNAGRFTMGDAFARRAPSRAIRITASVITLVALLPLMVVQLSGAGHLLSFILGFDSEGFIRTGAIVMIGILMISYAAIGGMKGTALIQIIKTVFLLGSGGVLAVLIMSRFDWSTSALLAAAKQGSGVGDAYLTSGLQFGGNQLDMISAELSVVLGAACLPHVTMRMYSSRTALAVRHSMSWAVSVVVVFCLLVAVIGVGAAALVGHQQIVASDPQGDTAILLVGQALLGGDSSTLETLIFTSVTTAIFLTLLASVAGMILACANSLAHDLFAHGIRRSMIGEATEMGLARVAAIGVGIPAIALAVLVKDWNAQLLVTLSFCIGASALAPALVFSLFWRRYTRTGLMCTLIGGTLCVGVLLAGSNLVSGSPQAVFPTEDFNWFPFTTTGLVSVPFGFFMGWLGTVWSHRGSSSREQRRQYEAVEAWILAGAGGGGPAQK